MIEKLVNIEGTDVLYPLQKRAVRVSFERKLTEVRMSVNTESSAKILVSTYHAFEVGI